MIMMMKIKKKNDDYNDDYDKEKKEEEKYDAEDDDDCDEDDDIMMSYIVFIKCKRLPCYWVLFILQLVCTRGALYCHCHDDGDTMLGGAQSGVLKSGWGSSGEQVPRGAYITKVNITI